MALNLVICAVEPMSVMSSIVTHIQKYVVVCCRGDGSDAFQSNSHPEVHFTRQHRALHLCFCAVEPMAVASFIDMHIRKSVVL